MRLKSCLFVAMVALALSSCGGKKSGGSLADLQDNQFAVRTVGASSADLQTTYPATIKGLQDVDVHPKISGFITNVYVHEGQTVSAGQPMFTIDSETYRAQVNQCRAALNTARAQANTARLTYLNNKKLFNQHIIGQYELETAENSYATARAQVAQAQAALAAAEETLSWCVVRAPSAGVVGNLPFKKGALVSASSTLTTVSDISTMEVFFSMSEPDILSMSKTAGSVAGVPAGPRGEDEWCHRCHDRCLHFDRPLRQSAAVAQEWGCRSDHRASCRQRRHPHSAGGCRAGAG